MNWLTIAGIALLGILLIELIIRLVFSRVVLRVFETQLPLNVDNHSPSPSAKRLEFTTADGITLRGSLHGVEEKNPVGLVIFCPELNGSHWSAAEYCEGLLEAGFLVLSFDFRNQGESEALDGYEPLHWMTEHEVTDIEAALQYVGQREDLARLPLGLMGLSRGGAVALAAAARHDAVQAVAVEGAFTTASMQLHYGVRWACMYAPRWFIRLFPLWHIRSTMVLCRWISQWRRGCQYTNLERLLPRLAGRPVLFIAGTHDSYVPLEIPRAMAQRVGNGPLTEVWEVPSARHNRARLVDPAVYDARVVNFFRHHFDLPEERPLLPPRHEKPAEEVVLAETSQRHQPTVS